MRVAVDQSLCIACGVCIHLCPEVFAWNEQGRSEAWSPAVPPQVEAVVLRVLDLCPVNAISRKEE